jgi:signal transduction histidine kinase
MTLRRRQLLTGLLVALPAAALLFTVVDRQRSRDRRIALERAVASFQTDSMRAECEADPQWFLAGPRSGRPSAEERRQPDAELRLPRPATDPLPFEFFPYDETFTGTSTASPRFPAEFRASMRSSPPARSATGPFDTPEGQGLQTAVLTGWTPGPCAALLFRVRPAPRHAATQAALFGGFALVSFAVAIIALAPTVARIRRLALGARDSARQSYATVVHVAGRDEISAIGAAFNEAVGVIRQRGMDARDRADALQRYVAYTSEDVAEPLDELIGRLGTIERVLPEAAAVQDDVHRAVRDAHIIVSRLRNLAAVAKLRASLETPARDQVDLSAVVDRVVARAEAVARASAVTLTHVTPSVPVVVPADASLVERAVSNLVDNAILHIRPGGRVAIDLVAYEHGAAFSLKVTDNGPGVADDEFAGLTAIGRFRGDEGRTGRGGRGLGLAIAREVADRFGLTLDLRRPAAGGFEAEIKRV